MGIFDAISDALSGKPQASAKPTDSGSGSGPGKGQGDFDEDMQIRARNMRAMGLNSDGSPMAKPAPAKPLPSMNDHADKMHPVPKMRGAQ